VFFDGLRVSIRSDSSGDFLLRPRELLPRVATIRLLLDLIALNFFCFCSAKSIKLSRARDFLSPDFLPRVAEIPGAGGLGGA